MIRKSLFAAAASLMTLSAFSGTLAVLEVEGRPTVSSSQIA